MYCKGTPATGQPVGPGTYTVVGPVIHNGSTFLAYACFEACTSIVGSLSSWVTDPDP